MDSRGDCIELWSSNFSSVASDGRPIHFVSQTPPGQNNTSLFLNLLIYLMLLNHNIFLAFDLSVRKRFSIKSSF
jgi:hypothetical protein